MTPEAQRIAIAEVCGTAFVELGIQYADGTTSFGNSEGYTRRKCGNYQAGGLNCKLVTRTATNVDYLFDLNAMHEAEKTLNPPPLDRERDREDDDPKWTAYCHELARTCPMGTWIRATAAQRAEAFLRTLNLLTP